MKLKAFFKVTTILLSLSLSLEAGTIFDYASKRHNVNKRILASIAYQESDFNMKVVGVTLDKKRNSEILKKCLSVIDCKSTFSTHRATIYPKNNEQARLLLLSLDRLHLDYDVGLMQINKYNIKKRHLQPIRLLSDIFYNIDIGAKIYKECANHFNNIEDSFECYNKGYDRRKFNYRYSDAIINKYRKLFSIK